MLVLVCLVNLLMLTLVTVTVIDSIAMVIVTATLTIHFVIAALKQVVSRPLLPLIKKEVSVETEIFLVYRR